MGEKVEKKNITMSLTSADRPIENIDQDKLNRGGFTYSIVQIIKSWQGKDSLVIGIRGPWGSGKSSIKNLIIKLIKSENNNIKILEFNPWEWSNTDRLHIGFFSELAKTIGKVDNSKRAKESAKGIRRYVAYLNVANIQEPVSKISTPLLALFAILGVSVSNITNIQWVKYIFAGLAIIFVIFPLFASILETFAKIKDNTAEKLDMTASEQNAALQSDLRGLDYTVLIILDEVDRLNSDELKILFQIIKANANFPNVIYLMFFDRLVVEREIGKFISGSPQTYLEKIIQVSLDVPQPSVLALWGVLENGLQQIFSSVAARLRFQPEPNIRLLYDITQPYFQDMRSVNRYLSNLNFHSSLYDRRVYEVNPRDLSLLEVLRMFEPEVYKRISVSKGALTGYISDYQVKRNESELAEIISVANNKESVNRILQTLFPNRKFVEHHAVLDSGNFSRSWYENAQVCSSEIFSRYFQFDISQQEISFSEVRILLDYNADPTILENEIRRYLAEGRLDQLLHTLDNLKFTIDKHLWLPLFISLSNIGDEVVDPLGSYIGAESSSTRIPYWILKDRAKPSERANILKETIKNSYGINMLARLLKLFDKEDEQEQILQEHELKELQGMVLDKIRLRVLNNTFLQSNRFMTNLYRWKEWGSADEVDRWIASQLNSRESWVALVRGFETESSFSDEYDVVLYRGLNEEVVNDFLKPNRALEAWDDLGILDPSPEENELISALNLIKNKIF